jgi:hypothetical protein
VRTRSILVVAAVSLVGSLALARHAQPRLNPLVELHIAKKPLFGLYAPGNRRPGRGGPPGSAAAANPEPVKSTVELVSVLKRCIWTGQEPISGLESG